MTTPPTYTRTLTAQQYHAWIRHPSVRSHLTDDTAARALAWMRDHGHEETIAVLILTPQGTPVEAWPIEYVSDETPMCGCGTELGEGERLCAQCEAYDADAARADDAWARREG